MAADVRTKYGRPSRGWIVAPTYDLAMEEWRHAEALLRHVIDWDKTSRQKKVMFFITGDELEIKSADSKDTTLRGAGLDYAIMAEAARIPREAWEQGIRPALSDKLGRAVFGSTPKGRNWFYDLYIRGLSGDKDYKSWQLPSNSRPTFPAEEWEALRRTLPELVFKQEFMAEFLEDTAAVFRKISGCVGGEFQAVVKDHKYLIGADLARTIDFTVLTVMDLETQHVVYWDRFNQLEWTFQKERIKWLAKLYNNAQVWMDSTGLGDPIEHDLRRAEVKVQGIKFTSESKKEMIEFLSIAIEQKMITYPEIPVLMNELSSFEYEILPSGAVRYCAPENQHDDCVMSLALCVWGLKNILYRSKKKLDKDPYEGLSLKDQAFWERWNKALKPKKETPREFVDTTLC